MYPDQFLQCIQNSDRILENSVQFLISSVSWNWKPQFFRNFYVVTRSVRILKMPGTWDTVPSSPAPPSFTSWLQNDEGARDMDYVTLSKSSYHVNVQIFTHDDDRSCLFTFKSVKKRRLQRGKEIKSRILGPFFWELETKWQLAFQGTFFEHSKSRVES